MDAVGRVPRAGGTLIHHRRGSRQTDVFRQIMPVHINPVGSVVVMEGGCQLPLLLQP